jgi:transposase
MLFVKKVQMAFKSILMDQIEKIRELLSKGHGNKSIARITGFSRNTVKKYRGIIEKIPLSSPNDTLKPQEVYSNYYVNSSKNNEELLLLIPDYIKRLSKVGTTREQLWEEYKIDHPDGYSYGEFCRKIKNFRRIENATINIIHKPAEVMQVDFAGKGIDYVDTLTGELKKAQILVCVLPFSKMLFVLPLKSQNTEDFIYGITCAINYFGGTPKRILSDNLKSYVTKADRYCPTFSQLALQLSNHYNVELDATRVAKPKDKASVERGVYLTYQNIHAHVNKLPIGDFDQLKSNIKTYLDNFNNKICKEFSLSRRAYFEANEKDLLNELPSKNFDCSKSIKAKVQNNYHFYLGEDKHYYSVPYKYIGKQVTVIYNRTLVEVYIGINRIALHDRVLSNGMTTNENHRPDKHTVYLQLSALTYEDYIAKASEVGSNFQWAVTFILDQYKDNTKQDKIAQALLSLVKHYKADRLEQVCTYISPCGIITFDMIKNVLSSCIDLNQFEHIKFNIPPHENIRGVYN